MTSLEQMHRERDELYGLPETESRSERTRALLRRAEAAGHTSLALSLRLDLLDVEDHLAGRTPPEHRGPRTDRMRVDFTRVLTLYDDHPEYFGEQEEETLWRTVDFLVGDLKDRAAAPVTHLTALLDDLERRFRPTGENLSMMLNARMLIANFARDHTRADELLHMLEHGAWLRIWTHQDFVEMHVTKYQSQDRHQEAIETARPLLEGRVRSTDPDGSPTDPRPLLLHLMESYLRTGRLSQAQDAFRRTAGLLQVELHEDVHWRSVEEEQAWITVLRLEFLSLSGNEERALALMRLIPPPAGTVSDFTQLLLAEGVGLACHRLTEIGRGHETVEALSNGAPREISVADLYQDRTEHAMRFARRADACCGNDYRSRNVHEHIHQRPVVDHLDLGPEGTPTDTDPTGTQR